MKKFYEDFGVDESVSMIIRDIIKNGKSIGWSGRTADCLEKVQEKCAKFNVVYVNDFYGEWAMKSI